MDLSNYRQTRKMLDGISFLENSNTGHKVVLKSSDINKGMKEVMAYKKMEDSAMLDYMIENGKILMLMHRHEGRSLSDWANSNKKKLVENIDMVFNSALFAVRRLHDSGVFHGRITPDKLIISDDFSVKIIGLSSALIAPDLEVKGGFNCHYDYYTAPELVFGQIEDAGSVDYFALSKCFSYLIRGDEDKVPFEILEKISLMGSVIPSERSIFKS